MTEFEKRKKLIQEKSPNYAEEWRQASKPRGFPKDNTPCPPPSNDYAISVALVAIVAIVAIVAMVAMG